MIQQNPVLCGHQKVWGLQGGTEGRRRVSCQGVVCGKGRRWGCRGVSFLAELKGGASCLLVCPLWVR